MPEDIKRMERFYQKLDAITKLYTTAEVMIDELNKRPGKRPVSISEFTVAMNTNNVIDIIGTHIDYLRDHRDGEATDA